MGILSLILILLIGMHCKNKNKNRQNKIEGFEMTIARASINSISNINASHAYGAGQINNDRKRGDPESITTNGGIHEGTYTNSEPPLNSPSEEELYNNMKSLNAFEGSERRQTNDHNLEINLSNPFQIGVEMDQ